MRKTTRLLSVLALATFALSFSAPTAARAAQGSELFVGHLVNTMASARFASPFVLQIDRWATQGDAQRLTGVLAARGEYALREDLWKSQAGYVRVGGRIAYPIAAAFVEETPSGRTIRVLLDRPLGFFETQYYSRSYHYPFAVVELNLDRNGKGEGRFIAAAKLQVRGDTLEIESLGPLPMRLLHVRASA
jgi:hypothetical protein